MMKRTAQEVEELSHAAEGLWRAVMRYPCLVVISLLEQPWRDTPTPAREISRWMGRCCRGQQMGRHWNYTEKPVNLITLDYSPCPTQWNLCHARGNQDRGSWWGGLDRMVHEANGKPLHILALNPMNSMKGKNNRILNEELPVRWNQCHRSTEKQLRKKRRDGAKQKYIWMWYKDRIEETEAVIWQRGNLINLWIKKVFKVNKTRMYDECHI